MELSSNAKKLVRHIDRIKQLKETPRPVMIDIAVNTECNANCPFCYVRNKETSSLDIDKLKHFIEVVNPLSIDISGGEPTLWPHTTELINWCVDRDIKVGLITNGIKLNDIPVKTLNRLTWLRISVNSYIEGNNKFKLPKRLSSNVYLGIMFVTWRNMVDAEWLNILYKLEKIKKKHSKIRYVKIVEDFTNIDIKVPDWINRWRFSFFVEHTIPRIKYSGICYIGWLKPLLDPDGKVYFCTGDVGILEKKKRVGSHFCTIDEPEKLFEYKDFEVNCLRCENYSKNQFIETVLADKILHEEFI